MHITVSNQRFTFYPTRKAAEVLAAANQADDDSAEYRVEQADRGFFVAIYEDGDRVGTL
jgi:hypothetical protein